MKTGERVDGTRAGAQAVRDALMQILKAGELTQLCGR